MPMHLLVGKSGTIMSAGATIRRLIGDPERFCDAFDPVSAGSLEELLDAERVFLRLRDHPDQVLRGRAVRVGGGALFNLGFGIGVIDAVRGFGLTDRDFAPSELVMELLFLHEANNAMTEELSRANLRLEEARSKAEAEAFTDPLTGLYNRRGLELAFAMLRDGALADPGRAFALLVLDLDHFKQLNDSRGHAAGDEMLRAVAARLRSVTRDEDVLARVGGDEFVALLPHVGDRTRLMALGARMIEAIRQPLTVQGADCAVSASLGGALSGDFAELTWTAIEAAADDALYAAKRAGRGRIHIAEVAGA